MVASGNRCGGATANVERGKSYCRGRSEYEHQASCNGTKVPAFNHSYRQQQLVLIQPIAFYRIQTLDKVSFRFCSDLSRCHVHPHFSGASRILGEWLIRQPSRLDTDTASRKHQYVC